MAKIQLIAIAVCFSIQCDKPTSGAKARHIFNHYTARLKPCPSQKICGGHKLHLAILGVYYYAVAVVHLVMQDFHRQWVLHQSLDEALEGPRSEVGS